MFQSNVENIFKHVERARTDLSAFSRKQLLFGTRGVNFSFLTPIYGKLAANRYPANNRSDQIKGRRSEGGGLSIDIREYV